VESSSSFAQSQQSYWSERPVCPRLSPRSAPRRPRHVSLSQRRKACASNSGAISRATKPSVSQYLTSCSPDSLSASRSVRVRNGWAQTGASADRPLLHDSRVSTRISRSHWVRRVAGHTIDRSVSRPGTASTRLCALLVATLAKKQEKMRITQKERSGANSSTHSYRRINQTFIIVIIHASFCSIHVSGF